MIDALQTLAPVATLCLAALDQESASEIYVAAVAELAGSRTSGGTERYDEEQVAKRTRKEVDTEDAILLMEQRWYESSNTLEEMVMRDNSVGFVYPGSLVWTAPLRDGRIDPLQQFPGRPEVPVVFSGIQGEDLNFTHDGSFFSFQAELLERSDRLQNSTPRLEIKIEYGKSLETALLRMGLSARYWSASLDASASRTTEERKSFAVMSIDQVYYTLVADTPPAAGYLPTSLLDANPVVASYLLGGLERGGEPGYVRRVDYGRKVIVSLSSSASEEDLRAAMRFSAGTGPFKIEAEAEAKAREVWEKTEVRAVVIGGKVTDGLIDALTGSFDGFLGNINAFLKETKDFTPDTGAAPVSFEVRYCIDNAGYANYETVEFSGQIPVGSYAKGGDVPRTVDVELAPADARKLRQDWDVHSDDWTGVEIEYALSPSTDGRSVELHLRMDIRELESGGNYDGKTHLRLEKRTRVYTLPDHDRRTISSVKSVQNAKTTSDKFSGELHDWFRFGDGVVGALRDVHVRVDSEHGDDKPYLGLRGTIDFTVVLDRER